MQERQQRVAQTQTLSLLGPVRTPTAAQTLTMPAELLVRTLRSLPAWLALRTLTVAQTRSLQLPVLLPRQRTRQTLLLPVRLVPQTRSWMLLPQAWPQKHRMPMVRPVLLLRTRSSSRTRVLLVLLMRRRQKARQTLKVLRRRTREIHYQTRAV